MFFMYYNKVCVCKSIAYNIAVAADVLHPGFSVHLVAHHLLDFTIKYCTKNEASPQGTFVPQYR